MTDSESARIAEREIPSEPAGTALANGSPVGSEGHSEADQIADTVRTMTTYRLANGHLIQGAFSFVNDLDYFEDEDWYTGPVEVIEEVWQVTSTRSLAVGGLDHSDGCSEVPDGN